MSRRDNDIIFHAVALTLLMVIVALCCLASESVPCSWYKYSASKDIPARCLKEFTK